MSQSSEDKTSVISVEDLRGAPRHPTVNFIWYRILGDEPEEDNDLSKEGICKSCDISETGLGLFLPRSLPLGSLVFIEIATPQIGLSAIGRVVHSKKIQDGYYRAGIRFVVIPPNDRLHLNRLFTNDGKGKR